MLCVHRLDLSAESLHLVVFSFDVTDALRSLAQILHLAHVFLVKHFFCLMRTLSVVRKYRLPSLSHGVTRWAMARDGGVSTDPVSKR